MYSQYLDSSDQLDFSPAWQTYFFPLFIFPFIFIIQLLCSNDSRRATSRIEINSWSSGTALLLSTFISSTTSSCAWKGKVTGIVKRFSSQNRKSDNKLKDYRKKDSKILFVCSYSLTYLCQMSTSCLIVTAVAFCIPHHLLSYQFLLFTCTYHSLLRYVPVAVL